MDQTGGSVFFSSAILNDMMKRTNCDAIRFYSAKSGVNGAESVLAVCVSAGADMKVKASAKTKYLLFTGVQNGNTSISQLSKEEAATAVQNVDGPRLAVTISNSELSTILKAEGCTGVEVIRSKTENGSPTFLLSSATLSGNNVVKNLVIRSVKSENPCPPSCGANLSQGYLSTISR